MYLPRGGRSQLSEPLQHLSSIHYATRHPPPNLSSILLIIHTNLFFFHFIYFLSYSNSRRRLTAPYNMDRAYVTPLGWSERSVSHSHTQPSPLRTRRIRRRLCSFTRPHSLPFFFLTSLLCVPCFSRVRVLFQSRPLDLTSIEVTDSDYNNTV